MYNLLVRSAGWSGQRDRIGRERLFEHTEPAIRQRFSAEGEPDFAVLTQFPALLLEESTARPEEQVVRLGSVIRVRPSGRDLIIDYAYDPPISGLTNQLLKDLADELEIEEWEFFRTHWAVKDVDLC